MLYVGVPERLATEPLRRAIRNIHVGRTGYVYVLNATGAARGHYVIAGGGRKDGEDLWNAQDGTGHFFIQEICRKAAALQPGETASERYPWRNPGEGSDYIKLARVKYFRPWDWVLGVSVPERELYETVESIDRIAAGEAGRILPRYIGLTALRPHVHPVVSSTGLVQSTGRTDRIVGRLGEVSQSMSSAAAEMSMTNERLARDTEQQSGLRRKCQHLSRKNGEHGAQRNLDDSHHRSGGNSPYAARGSAETGRSNCKR